MNYPIYFDSKNSNNLFGLNKNFKFLSNLYLEKNLPKVLMFTGNKGVGKATLVNHFLHSIFDERNYNKNNLTFQQNTIFGSQLRNNFFQNIIYINGADFKSVKIEDIRNLKKKILQSTISSKERFIIFDDIELFNHNSLNALLKIIEEPSEKNYFFLINNKSKPLLETIKSRALELKIILNENQRMEVINKLIDFHKLELILDPKTSKLSPGNFVKFNHICKEYNIDPVNDLVENFTLILNLHKKNKDVLFINLIFFITDYYLKHVKDKNLFDTDKIFEIKNHIFESLNNFIIYNINQNSLINAVNQKLNYE